MNEFERLEPSYRLAETYFGDDLQAVSARELGDANRWAELVWLNNLRHPYLTDDALLANESVRLNGTLIKIPAPVGVYTDDASRGQVYEKDCILTNKLLSVNAGGDLAVASGVKNLTQQLKHRIDTPKGQARRHPDYGCLVWRLKGSVTGPTAETLGSEYVKSTLIADYRVSSVVSSSAITNGDAIMITAKVESIEGAGIDISNLS